VDDLIQKARQGHRRSIARLISQVENSDAAAQTAVTALHAHSGRAHLIGVTGSPGSGKSSLVNEIAKAFRRRQARVGIVAVDPSSPFTGGAVLGDRVRMRDLAGDDAVFIRSMASRGSLGGLARATSTAAKILDAAGFDVILIETVGAGQAEVEIAGTAHTVLVVEAPGMGDDIQSIKAGILEIADILVVNKADRPGANRAVQALKMMLHLAPAGYAFRGHHGPAHATLDEEAPAPATKEIDGWDVPVLEAVATAAKGIDEVVAAITGHRDYLQAGGEWQVRERERSRQEIERLLQARFMAQLRAAVAPVALDEIVAAVAAREVDPYTAVDRLFSQLKGEKLHVAPTA
jgi:LAO/AO transport system kinase